MSPTKPEAVQSDLRELALKAELPGESFSGVVRIRSGQHGAFNRECGTLRPRLQPLPAAQVPSPSHPYETSFA